MTHDAPEQQTYFSERADQLPQLLIVDDSMLMRAMLKDAIANQGYVIPGYLVEPHNGPATLAHRYLLHEQGQVPCPMRLHRNAGKQAFALAHYTMCQGDASKPGPATQFDTGSASELE